MLERCQANARYSCSVYYSIDSESIFYEFTAMNSIIEFKFFLEDLEWFLNY